MLSQNQVVAARRAIELTYTGTCIVIEYRKKPRENKSTGFEEEIVLENQPCRLSFERILSTNQGQAAANLTQSAKLFISPEIHIKPGSKLTVAQNGVVTDYKNSGEPALYATHQEVMLELFKGWA